MSKTKATSGILGGRGKGGRGGGDAVPLTLGWYAAPLPLGWYAHANVHRVNTSIQKATNVHLVEHKQKQDYQKQNYKVPHRCNNTECVLLLKRRYKLGSWK